MKKALKNELLKIKKQTSLKQELLKYKRSLLFYTISLKDGTLKDTSVIKSTRKIIALLTMLVNKSIKQNIIKN
ncbi:MAG: hypothetical protein RL208_57 [Pseudomonadota bacterium]|jgi:ribosomal protein L29